MSFSLWCSSWVFLSPNIIYFALWSGILATRWKWLCNMVMGRCIKGCRFSVFSASLFSIMPKLYLPPRNVMFQTTYISAQCSTNVQIKKKSDYHRTVVQKSRRYTWKSAQMWNVNSRLRRLVIWEANAFFPYLLKTIQAIVQIGSQNTPVHSIFPFIILQPIFSQCHQPLTTFPAIQRQVKVAKLPEHQ